MRVVRVTLVQRRGESLVDQIDVWEQGDAQTQSCLLHLHEVEQRYIESSLQTINECLSDDCTPASLTESRKALRQQYNQEFLGECSPIEDTIGINSTHLLKNLDTQIDCITSTVHPDVGEHSLTCGPSNAEFQIKRGEWQQIIVDSEKWGTLCGDGTDFAFQVRFAPEGYDLDNVLIGLQGGGVCVFEEDCTAKMANAPGLFNAQDDIPYNIAVSSLDPEVSPLCQLDTGIRTLLQSRCLCRWRCNRGFGRTPTS